MAGEVARSSRVDPVVPSGSAEWGRVLAQLKGEVGEAAYRSWLRSITVERVEVRRLAAAVSISEVHAGVSPEEKLAIVRRETARARTMFIGDGINDAPALMAATVGIAFGQHSDITSEAARVVVVDSSLSTVDELMHLARRLGRIALQSAVGGMSASAPSACPSAAVRQSGG